MTGKYTTRIWPVVLAGGIGKRLWPLSTARRPKQFIELIDGLSLFQKTIERCLFENATPITVIGSEKFELDIRMQTQDLGVFPNLLLEPDQRNTCPSLLCSAEYLSQTEDFCKTDDLMLVLPCDHYITDHAKFWQSVNTGVRDALNGSVVTFGVEPNRPETGFGYIKVSRPITSNPCQVEKFIEKPDIDTAIKMLQMGDVYWNSGIFLAKPSAILKLGEMFAPVDLAYVKDSLRNSKILDGGLLLSKEQWNQITPASFDIAIIERAKNIVCAHLNCTWDDLGSWHALARVFGELNENNNFHGSVQSIQCTNNFIWSDFGGPELLTYGVDNIAVVASAERVFVTSRSNLEEMNEVSGYFVEKQKDMAGPTKNICERPWGSFEVITGGLQYQVKRILVNPGGRLSLQSHKFRSEHWVVVSGTACVEIDGVTQYIEENTSVFIRSGIKHRLSNLQTHDLILIEVQTGTYFGEDDIIRYEDDYHRIS